MNVSKEKKMEEAIKRMKMLDLFGLYIKDFKQSGRIQISEPPFGSLYWLNEKDDKDLIDYIKEFENDGERLVYLVVRTVFRELGVLDSLFYVSDYPEEWESDYEDMKEGYQIVNVYNHDAPWCSESGTISFKKTIAKGIVRTG